VKKSLLRHDWYYEQWLNISGTQRQPDLFVVLDDRTLLFEFKLSFTLEGIQQLQNIYAPALGSIFQRPVVCCQVARNLRPLAAIYDSTMTFDHLVTALHEGPFVWQLLFPEEENL
jgi:hypothetical protein